MAEEVYLYCLTRPEGRSAVESIKSPVFCREFHGILAVCALEDSSEFTPGNLGELSWVGARAAFHEQVVETVMTASTVVPVRFGAFFRSEDSLEKFVRGNAATIAGLLDSLCGCAEWSVKVFLDEPAVSKRFMKEAPAASPGRRYLLQRQIEEEAREKVNLFSAELLRSLEADLSRSALGRADLRLSDPSRNGERMVFHKGFLVAERNLPEFRIAIDRYRERNGMRIELHGPWPPHHFCPNLIET